MWYLPRKLSQKPRVSSGVFTKIVDLNIQNYKSYKDSLATSPYYDLKIVVETDCYNNESDEALQELIQKLVTKHQIADFAGLQKQVESDYRETLQKLADDSYFIFGDGKEENRIRLNKEAKTGDLASLKKLAKEIKDDSVVANAPGSLEVTKIHLSCLSQQVAEIADAIY